MTSIVFAIAAGLCVGYGHNGWGVFLGLLALMSDGADRATALARVIAAVSRRRP